VVGLSFDCSAWLDCLIENGFPSLLKFVQKGKFEPQIVTPDYKSDASANFAFFAGSDGDAGYLVVMVMQAV
jgi:hypothetical protein